MNRGLVLGTLVAADALSAAVGSGPAAARGQAAVPPAPAAAAIQADKIADNLYLLRGGGRIVQAAGVSMPNAGNSVAFVTATGVVLVDTKLPGWGAATLDKIRELTDKPVTMIINSHSHVDHVGGNLEFSPAVDIVAHENAAALMREMRPVAGGPPQPNLFTEQNGRGLPRRTFRDRMTIGEGADRIELYYFGRAHTSGDAWVVFPALRAVHAGDVFGNKVVPLLDANNGASGVEYPQTVARAIAALRDVDIVTTGHYPGVLTRSDLVRYGEFTREFVQAVQDAKRRGGTIDEFVASWKMPDRYVADGYLDFSALRSIRADVEVIWNETP